MCERESKANNVVIYGLDEPPLDIKAGLARKEQDEQSLKDLFADISVNLEDDAIKFSYRLGPMGLEVVEKPRPLNIGLRTKEAREKLFNKARGLKDSADFYNISIIVPDLTKQQRAEDQDLRKEADILNLDMEATDQGNWVYRCVGVKGQRTIQKFKTRQTDTSRGERGRGATSHPGPTSRLPTTSASTRTSTKTTTRTSTTSSTRTARTLQPTTTRTPCTDGEQNPGGTGTATRGPPAHPQNSLPGPEPAGGAGARRQRTRTSKSYFYQCS